VSKASAIDFAKVQDLTVNIGAEQVRALKSTSAIGLGLAL
jgi:hypothetical protein